MRMSWCVGRTDQPTAPQCRLDIQHERFVGCPLEREPEGDPLPVSRMLLRGPGAVAELEHLGRAGDEKVGRSSLDPPQPRCNARVTSGQPCPDRVVDQIVGHNARGSSGTTTGAPISRPRSVNSEIPSIIAPFCFAAMSRRNARSRTARFDRSPVSALARSMSRGSRSTLVTAIAPPPTGNRNRLASPAMRRAPDRRSARQYRR